MGADIQPAPGRPKAAERPLGGQERSDVGADIQPAPGRPKAAERPLGGQERSDVGALVDRWRPVADRQTRRRCGRALALPAAQPGSSIKPMSLLLIKASMSIRISMRSATLPMPVM